MSKHLRYEHSDRMHRWCSYQGVLFFETFKHAGTRENKLSRYTRRGCSSGITTSRVCVDTSLATPANVFERSPSNSYHHQLFLGRSLSKLPAHNTSLEHKIGHRGMHVFYTVTLAINLGESGGDDGSRVPHVRITLSVDRHHLVLIRMDSAQTHDMRWSKAGDRAIRLGSHGCLL